MRPVTADEFWARVQRGPGCWEWLAGKCKGYGRVKFRINGSLEVLAPRVSWFLTHGIIPDDRFVLHECDNPGCVRPEHLYLGTHADNMRDKAERGRAASSRRGMGHPNARLSDEQAVEIRRRWVADGIRQKDLAAQYGVSQSTIWNVIHGERYAEAPA